MTLEVKEETRGGGGVVKEKKKKNFSLYAFTRVIEAENVLSYVSTHGHHLRSHIQQECMIKYITIANYCRSKCVCVCGGRLEPNYFSFSSPDAPQLLIQLGV